MAGWATPVCAPIPLDTEQALVATTNQVRAQYGLGPVRADAALSQAAHGHACAMAWEGTLSHHGGDHTDPAARAQRAGFSGCRVLENIAAGQHTADQAFWGWMARAGHRRNVLDAHVDAVGFGAVAYDGARGGNRWVMVLGGGC